MFPVMFFFFFFFCQLTLFLIIFDFKRHFGSEGEADGGRSMECFSSFLCTLLTLIYK